MKERKIIMLFNKHAVLNHKASFNKQMHKKNYTQIKSLLSNGSIISIRVLIKTLVIKIYKPGVRGSIGTMWI